MKRPLRRAIVLLSTPLTVALLALWLRSYFVLDEVSRVDETGATQALVSFGGSIHLIRCDTLAAARAASWDAYPFSGRATLGPLYDPLLAERRLLGFAQYVRPAVTRGTFLNGSSVELVPWLAGSTYEAWVIPLWGPTLVVSIPALVALTRWTRQIVRRRRGQCVQCGYDIRATAVRCPECGGAIRVSPATVGAA